MICERFGPWVVTLAVQDQMKTGEIEAIGAGHSGFSTPEDAAERVYTCLEKSGSIPAHCVNRKIPVKVVNTRGQAWTGHLDRLRQAFFADEPDAEDDPSW